MKRFLMVGALVCAGLVPAAPAAADTPGCVSHAEFDNMEKYLSTQQVAGRFDTAGYYIGSGPERFRRGYDPCWTDLRRVVVWFSLTTGLSDDWAVQDY
jgi:hypothetical protein